MQIDNNNALQHYLEDELGDIFVDKVNDNQLSNEGLRIATITGNGKCKRDDFGIEVNYMMLQLFNKTEGADKGECNHNLHKHLLELKTGDKVLIALVNNGKNAVVLGKLG